MIASSSGQRRWSSAQLLFSHAFRPFFLGAALWAVIAVGVWIGVVGGQIGLASPFSPVYWHVHELLFGYAGAVLAGFLLTAVPGWTGRTPMRAVPLLCLFGLWMGGRLALLLPLDAAPLVLAAIDLAFPLTLLLCIARELIVSRNTRNLPVLALLLLFVLANALFHVAIGRGLAPQLSVRLGLSALLLMIMLIGGRIVPIFTRNWLVPRAAGRLPAVFGRFDAVTLAISAVALAAWTFMAMPAWAIPEWAAADWAMPRWLAALLFIAGLLNSLRLLRWAGYRTLAEPLVAILHIGYAFVPLGFLAMAAAGAFAQDVPVGSALHLWTTGAIGVMTMAMMTRASLGHSGRPLHADGAIVGIYVALLASVVMRFVAGFGYADLVNASALAWIAAYLGFFVYYTRLFITDP